MRALPLLLPLALLGCASPRTLAPADADRIHRSCSERMASGAELTRRARDIGKLPEGLGTHDRVVIYGADWCDACHAAADYLSRLGIPFVEHDIELDQRARDALDRTLALAALPEDRRLPVIEVRGTVMYGFMPCVVEAAWRGGRAGAHFVPAVGPAGAGAGVTADASAAFPPQSQVEYLEPSSRQNWPPLQPPGPTHAWVAPGTHAVVGPAGAAATTVPFGSAFLEHL